MTDEPFMKSLVHFEVAGLAVVKFSVRRMPSLVLHTATVMESLASFTSMDAAKKFADALSMEWKEPGHQDHVHISAQRRKIK